MVGASTDKYYISLINPSSNVANGTTVSVTVTSEATSDWADTGSISVVATKQGGGVETVSPTSYQFTSATTKVFTFNMPTDNITLTLEYSE